jgi:hypothetical protein
MLDSEVVKYLNKYQIKGHDLLWNPNNNIFTAVVIPAIKEFNNIKVLFNSLVSADPTFFSSTLFVFVVNNTATSNKDIKEDNLKTIELMKSIVYKIPNGNLIKDVISSGLQVGYINASTPGNEFSEKDAGVGLARKTGLDEALKIFNYKDKTPKLLICLDADCTVKSNYLNEIYSAFSGKEVNAGSIHFEHIIRENEEADLAITIYEIFLRYYILGLRYAGSYYAFNTIGSAMACDHSAYIKAEGMNKKKAAEDFYFLEKISKNSKIFNINRTTVYPSGRKSWRVPFGTGQRITRFHAGTHEEYLLYNPDVFEILREWLILFHADNIMSTSQYLYHAKEINKNLHNFLIFQNFESNMGKIIKSSKSDDQVRRQKLTWFDGFRTLKLIHFLRDNGTPNIFILDALNAMFSKLNISFPPSSINCAPDQKTLFRYLDRLRILELEERF